MQSLNVTPSVPSKFMGRVPYQEQSEFAQQNFFLSGITRDSSGTVLPNCTVDLFQTGIDILAASTVSDATGNFTFYVRPNTNFYALAYKAGSPDVMGTTVNTLTGA